MASFGSFLRGVGAQLNPFDRGQTFSTVRRDEEEKRRRAAELLRQSNAAKALNLNQAQQSGGLRIQTQPKPAISAPKLYDSSKQSNLSKFISFGPGAFKEAARDLGVGMARGIARTPETVARSYVQFQTQPFRNKMLQKGANVPSLDSAPPTDPVRRFLYGSEPVQTYQTRRKGYEDVVKGSRFKGAAGPLANLGLGFVVATDLLPPGKGGKNSFEALAKADTAQGVSKILSKLKLNLSDEAVQGITATKDPNLIKAIVESETKQPAKRIQLPSNPQDVNKRLDKAAEEAKTRYKAPNIFRRGERQVNPASPLSRIDYAAAKEQGVKRVKLPARESLEHLYDVSLGNKAPRVYQKAQEFGVDKVIQKYGEGTKAGKEFRNYQNAKFGLEVAQKRGLGIIPDESGNKIPAEDLAKFVQDYEARNPEAALDNAAFKRWMDDYLDRAEKAEVLEPGTAREVSGFYENYVPINRIFPENLERAGVNAAPVGGLGRQSILQSIEGSGLPVDNSFNVFFKRAAGAESQIDRNNLFNLFRQRAESGLVPDSRIVQSADQVRAQRELKDLLTQLNEFKAGLKKKGQKLAGNLKASRLQTKQSEKELVSKVRDVLKKNVSDVDAQAAVNDLSTSDILEISNNMIEGNIQGTWRLTKSFTKKSAAHQKLADELSSIRDTIQGVNNASIDTRGTLASIQTEPTTGRQILTGQHEGVPVKIEVSPEVATVLQGLDQQKLNGVLEFSRFIQKPFRAAFTGWANPIFSATSFAFYDAPAGFMNSPKGIRTIFSPKAIGEMFTSLSKNADFQKRLTEGGAQIATGSLSPANLDVSAKYLAAQKNLFSKIKYNLNPKNIKETIERLDVLGGKLQGATRTRLAKVSYDDALRRNLSEPEAIAEAVYAYNNIMPNYQRASTLLRQIDAVIPYTSASAAGTRAAGIATRRRPVATLAKAGVLLAPATAVVAHNLSNEKGEEFYQDMIDSKKDYILDSNFVIVLPTASKDPRTGAWDGIIKIPVAPELRSLNKLAWRQSRDIMTGQNNVKVQDYARAVFDTVTGQTFTGADNPVLQTGVGLATNVNPRTGNEIVYEDLQDKPKSEQFTDRTSELAKKIGNAIGQSPMKVQFAIDQFGAGGRLVTGTRSPFEEVKQRFTGAFGKSDGAKFFAEADKVRATIKDPDDKKIFDSLHAKDPTPGMLDSSEKALNFMNRPDVYRAEKKLDEWSRSQGKPGNPIFDLNPEKLQKVMAYRSAKMLNAGKQTYDKNGEPLFTALGLDEPWYEELRDKETEFYKKINNDKITNLQKEIEIAPANKKAELRAELIKTQAKLNSDEEYDTFSGGAKPKASKELQALLDKYYTLPKGTGQRSSMLRAYPEILEYWELSDGFTNRERAAIGLKPISSDEDGFGRGFGFGFFNEPAGRPAPNISNFLGKNAGISFDDTPKIKLRNFKTVKIPSAVPARRINVSSLTLPSRAPTFGSKNRKR